MFIPSLSRVLAPPSIYIRPMQKQLKLPEQVTPPESCVEMKKVDVIHGYFFTLLQWCCCSRRACVLTCRDPWPVHAVYQLAVSQYTNGLSPQRTFAIVTVVPWKGILVMCNNQHFMYDCTSYIYWDKACLKQGVHGNDRADILAPRAPITMVLPDQDI